MCFILPERPLQHLWLFSYGLDEINILQTALLSFFQCPLK